MTNIAFYKMQGTGNDFIIINNKKLKLSHNQLSILARKLCKRRISIGSDSLMATDFPENTGDFRMRFYNSNGTEAEMCGNGARCIARFAYDKIIAKDIMTIETLSGNIIARRLNERTYKIQLNKPTKLKFNCPFFDEKNLKIDYIELGNPGIPHLTVSWPNLLSINLENLKDLAKKLRNWNLFQKGANVNFYELLPGKLIVRTFERGVEDFTLSCGTGAASVVYILSKKKILTTNTTSVNVLGGILKVDISNNDLNLIGTTNIVAEGVIRDEELFL